MIVMSYAKKGNLRKCLSSVVKLEWQYKLQLLKNIILGLKTMHESNLVHHDFHDGNILISDNYETYIIDLGLCKLINNSLQNETDENYGVIPYMAPEVLSGNPYTLASDIYSFSIIMWEFTSGVPPFNNRAHDDLGLILDICEGEERPKIIKNTPKCYIDLMKKCWDSDSSKRPTIGELEHIISQWLRYVKEYYEKNKGNDGHYRLINVADAFANDIDEFIKANKALSQGQTDEFIKANKAGQTDIYNKKLTYYNLSECLSCAIY
jgi:serine/threonine protein kinase